LAIAYEGYALDTTKPSGRKTESGPDGSGHALQNAGGVSGARAETDRFWSACPEPSGPLFLWRPRVLISSNLENGDAVERVPARFLLRLCHDLESVPARNSRVRLPSAALSGRAGTAAGNRLDAVSRRFIKWSPQNFRPFASFSCAGFVGFSGSLTGLPFSPQITRMRKTISTPPPAPALWTSAFGLWTLDLGLWADTLRTARLRTADRTGSTSKKACKHWLRTHARLNYPESVLLLAFNRLLAICDWLFVSAGVPGSVVPLSRGPSFPDLTDTNRRQPTLSEAKKTKTLWRPLPSFARFCAVLPMIKTFPIPCTPAPAERNGRVKGMSVRGMNSLSSFP
jgi:hypothetical protein